MYEEAIAIPEDLKAEIELESESTMCAAYLESVMKTRNQYSSYYGRCHLKNGELIVKLTDTSNDVVAYFEELLVVRNIIKYIHMLN